MQITTERLAGFAILHLRGEFDSTQCSRLEQEVLGLERGGMARLALDLRMVRFINSTALGTILEAYKRLSERGGMLVIARPSRFCREILRKIGLDRVVPVLDSADEVGRALLEGAVEAEADDTPAATPEGLADEAGVLFTPRDPDRVRLFIPVHRRLRRPNPVHGHVFGACWQGVGVVREVTPAGLRFTWSGGRAGLTPFEMGRFLARGTELEVKFRLPLLQRGYLAAVVTVSRVRERADGVEIRAAFTEVAAEILEAVRQYAADLDLLRGALDDGDGDGNDRRRSA